MYKIACCDDDTVFLEHFSRICKDIFQRSHIEYQLDTFVTFEPLYERCIQNPEYYNLLVLDVLLSDDESENGIVWGQRLRENGISCSILLVSSSKDFILDGYDVQAIHYIVKPVDLALLEKILLKDYHTNHMPQRLVLTKGSAVTAVYFKDILYIESIQRTTVIHTEQDVITCSLHLEDLLSQLPSATFIRCHQSYILNFSHVTMIRRYEACLSSQENVPISKAYFKTVQSKFVRFLCEKL